VQGGPAQQATAQDAGDHPRVRELHEPRPARQRARIQAEQPHAHRRHQVQLQQEHDPAPLHGRHLREEGEFFYSVVNPDPDPKDPYVFGPPRFGSVRQVYRSGLSSNKIERKTLISTVL
jgi:hypothetical protein